MTLESYRTDRSYAMCLAPLNSVSHLQNKDNGDIYLEGNRSPHKHSITSVTYIISAAAVWMTVIQFLCWLGLYDCVAMQHLGWFSTGISQPGLEFQAPQSEGRRNELLFSEAPQVSSCQCSVWGSLGLRCLRLSLSRRSVLQCVSAGQTFPRIPL